MKRGGRRVTRDANVHAPFTQADVRAAVAGLRGSVSFQAPLREYTSFKIGGPADVVVEPADIEDVCLVVQQARARARFRSSSWVGQICLSEMEGSAAS